MEFCSFSWTCIALNVQIGKNSQVKFNVELTLYVVNLPVDAAISDDFLIPGWFALGVKNCLLLFMYLKNAAAAAAAVCKTLWDI